MDLGADENYIYWKIAEKIKIKLWKKQEPYKLYGIGGERTSYNKEMVAWETTPTHAYVNSRKQRESFDITELGEHQIILRRKWLKENPQIDWTIGEVYFRRKEVL